MAAPLRRSARLSSQAPSTPLPPTPARQSGRVKVPNRARSALPAIPTFNSKAYGAQGRAPLGEELEVQDAGFAEAFGEQRAHMSLAGPSGVQEPAQPTAGPSTLPSASGADVTTSSGQNTSKSFGGVREGGVFHEPTGLQSHMTPPVRPIETPRRRSPRMPVPGSPSQARLAMRTVRRSPREVIAVAGYIFLGFLIACFILGANIRSITGGSGAAENIGLNPLRALHYYACNTFDSISCGYNFMTSEHTSIADIPSDLVQRVSVLERDVSEGRKLDQLHEGALRSLHEELPDLLAIHRDEAGELQVSNFFWAALGKRLGQLHKGTNTDVEDPDWKEVLELNEARVRAITASAVEEQAGINQALEQRLLVSKQEFTQALEEKYKVLSEDIRKYVVDKINAVEDRINEAAQRAAETATEVSAGYLRDIPFHQLEALINYNVIANAELVRKVNFFSPSLGAVVDPHMTSPTQPRKPVTLLERSLSPIATFPQSYPPVMALQSWDELTDCWCSSKSKTGQSQIAVILPYKIIPAAVTVEHVPREGTLDISSAPKRMELWVEIEEPAVRDVVRLNTPLTQRCAGPQVGPRFVCVSEWTYNVNSLNHVQTFPVDDVVHRMGVPVRKVVVRVVENWGQDWTCIYRLRMHGKLAQEPYPRL